MAKKKNSKNKETLFDRLNLSPETQRWIFGILMFLVAIIIALSFFNLAGIVGIFLMKILPFLIGRTLFVLPLFFALSGLLVLSTKYENFFWQVILTILILTLGLSGILGSLNGGARQGGWLGFVVSFPLISAFGFWVTQIIFGTMVIIGGLIFWNLSPRPSPKETGAPATERDSFVLRTIKKVRGSPKFKVKTLEPKRETPEFEPESFLSPELKQKPIAGAKIFSFQPPPISLLESERGVPNSGDIRANSAIIKKTLQNFGIEVEMSEVNVGPTVTQYTLKPAEGVMLSKITALSNNLSLALASHPLRIEAPIPGRPLVGIEVPNKARTYVRLRNLIENPNFQNPSAALNLALGKDVAGNPVLASLAKMPHLLVAGATGTGKTCAADTLMFTERGMLTFEELCPLSLNSEIDFKVKLVTRDGIETTSKNYNNGICQFYKLSTSRGYQIKVTAEHPLWVINEDGSQGWQAASLIKKGDRVAISRGPALFGNKIDLSDFKPRKIKAYHRKISFPSKMTPRLSQFLGLLTADGGLSIERRGIHRITYTQADPYLLSLYKESLKELFDITQFIEKRAGSNPKNKAKEIEVNSKHLKEFLAYLGMDSVKSPQKEIPRAIKEAPKEIVAVYLRAIFDNDGYVGKNSIELLMSSKKLTSQAHFMLLNFGIVSSLSIKKVKNYAHNEYYRLSIFGEEARKFIREIGFIRKEKYNKAKEFLKLSPNPNVDLIPHISSLLKDLGQKYLNRFARLTNRGWKYQSGILVPKYAFNSLRSYNSGLRAPGYQSLEKILDFYQPISQEPEYQELEKIAKRNFYWDKIEKIERTSGVGYDFYVPGSDSFVGNGFVNHNTIFLNSLVLSLLYQPSSSVNPFGGGPEILRFILIDPKRVEFTAYNQLPHLLCPVIYDAVKTINVLKWLTGEMERRFEVLAAAKAKDITSYNIEYLKTLKGQPSEQVLAKEKLINEKKMDSELPAQEPENEDLELLPYIVLIIDELADLMAARGREIEAGIVRLAQMARAVGIHLVVATQRPSVEVITGLIKANITSRVTFQVAAQVDSRTVLDVAGAERLLGLGDMLYISAETIKPKRIQGAYVSDKEVRKIVKYIKSEAKVPFSIQDLEIREGIENGLTSSLEESLKESGEKFGASFVQDDPLYEEAKKMVLEAKKASASLLQRRLRVGYARAARLIDTLEEKGVVGPADGAKPRQILYRTEAQQKEIDSGWEKV